MAAGGAELLIYDSASGTLVKTLAAHKDKVTCLSAVRNGFASGSNDKTVIIWWGGRVLDEARRAFPHVSGGTYRGRPSHGTTAKLIPNANANAHMYTHMSTSQEQQARGRAQVHA